jgi:hypothetical protein
MAAKITSAYGARQQWHGESNGGGVAWQSAAWQHGIIAAAARQQHGGWHQSAK